jgi:hypothetical protein
VSNACLIAFRGEIGAGKSEAAQCLVSTRGYVRVSFADPLRDVARTITPDGQIDKLRDRALLQFLGDYMRQQDPQVFLRRFTERVEALLADGVSVVNDDARYPAEIDYVAKRGTIVWVDTPEAIRVANLTRREGGVQYGIQGHASEAHLDPSDLRISYYLPNLSTKSDLWKRTDVIAGLIERGAALVLDEAPLRRLACVTATLPPPGVAF